MQVETYEVEEIHGELETMAADSDALELIEKLGLDGQKSLSDPDTATRQPYRQMTQLERNLSAILFPVHTPLKRFRQEPIPLRVLQVASHANDLSMFKHLEVWHPANAKEKDPLLVGVGTHPEFSWREEYWLLARWGDALLTWEELAEKAKRIWLTRTKASLEAVRQKVDSDLTRLESIAAVGFTGGELEELAYTV